LALLARMEVLRGGGGRRRLCTAVPNRASAASALNYCVELVKQHDRERFLCNLHAPASARPGLFAVQAFNCETAKIRSTARQDAAAFGRLAWWRDALERAAADRPPDHPVAIALAHTCARHRITHRFLMQILDAREDDLRVLQPRSMDELRQYAERTAGSLLLLGLECADVAGSEAAERAAAHAGTALGLATLLRATAAHAAQGCTYLPADVTSRHGVHLSSVRPRAPNIPYSACYPLARFPLSALGPPFARCSAVPLQRRCATRSRKSRTRRSRTSSLLAACCPRCPRQRARCCSRPLSPTTSSRGCSSMATHPLRLPCRSRSVPGCSLRSCGAVGPARTETSAGRERIHVRDAA
jgi:phytoene/squalene synthetase